MRKLMIATYGAVAYLGFLGVFLYLIGFLANFGVPKSVDSGTAPPLGLAASVDALLILLFALQHSLMARPAFKRWWTGFVPASIERTTYVMFSNVVVVALFVVWQPISAIVWDVQSPALRIALWSLYAFGLALVVFSTLLINHFDLFGLRQIWVRLRDAEYQPLGFRTPFLYRYVRHPIYVGWTLVFFATPTLSAGHLLLATAMLAYMLVAIRFEERDLEEAHAEYAEYRRRVPMLIPRFGRSAMPTTAPQVRASP